MKQTMLERGADDLDMVRQLEATLEGTGRDALIQDVATGFGGRRLGGGFLGPANGQRIFLRFDRKVLLGKAGDGDTDPVVQFAGALDIIGRVAGHGVGPGCLIEHREEPVETDRGAVERR